MDKYGPENLTSTLSNPMFSGLKSDELANRTFVLENHDKTISVTFRGDRVIDETNLFDRIKTPLPMKFLFDISGIDPTYTRFYGSTFLTMNEFDDTLKGNGILEFMDLR